MFARLLLVAVACAPLLLRSCDAWVTTLTPLNGRTSSTRRFMFDWMNPSSKKKDSVSKQPTDFLTGFFEAVAPPHHEEEAKAEKVEAAIVEALEAEEVAIPEAPAASSAATTSSKDEAAPTSATNTMHGTVKWFSPKKGYGFIDVEGRSEPIFVHHSAIQGDDTKFFKKLVPTEEVEFGLQTDDQGREKAIHVTGPAGQPVQAIVRQQQGLDRKQAREQQQQE